MTALCHSRHLTGTDTGKQAPNPDWHVTEQGAERGGVMTLAGQHASTSHAQAPTLAHHGHLCRDDLGLDCSCELLRLRETETKAGQASLFIALETSKLHLRRLSGLQLRHQFHPPHHLRHQLTLVT
jgi:hypothetical protein